MKHEDQYPIQFSRFYQNMATSIAAPLSPHQVYEIEHKQ